MALPLPLQSGLLPSEIEYLATSSTTVSIVPLTSIDRARFLSGVYGPFRPPARTTVPLWLALNLKRKGKCYLVVPEWMLAGEFALESGGGDAYEGGTWDVHLEDAAVVARDPIRASDNHSNLPRLLSREPNKAPADGDNNISLRRSPLSLRINSQGHPGSVSLIAPQGSTTVAGSPS